MILRFVNIFLKSNFNSLINFKLIFLLLITSFVIDSGRCLGAVKSFLFRIGINNIITFFLLLYFICFNTPIMSIMASNLIASENISIEKNYDAIEKDMNARNSGSKKNKQDLTDNKTRKKREELSISATKSIKKENIEIVVSFD